MCENMFYRLIPKCNFKMLLNPAHNERKRRTQNLVPIG